MVELFQEEFEQHFAIHLVSSFSGLTSLSPALLQELDAVLLDMELPEGKVGLEAIQHLKAIGLRTPVLVFSNDESLQSRLQMLSNGADDYLWKAMDPEEILVRIRNAISRYQQSKNGFELNLGTLVLSPGRLSARLGNGNLEFSKLEFHLMLLMIRNRPRPVTFAELRNEVWKASSLEVGTINTFVWKLNKKLQDWEYRVAKTGDTLVIQPKSAE